MSEVHDVLARPKADEIIATEASADIRHGRTLDAGVLDGLTSIKATQLRMAGSHAGDDHNTFLEVTAAWIGGDLTDENYWTIYGAATGTRKEVG